MQETFKAVQFRGKEFMVSESGKLMLPNGKIRRTHKNSSGYESLTLGNKLYLVHRIVAEAFIPNPENKLFVNHLDGNKFNNHVSNLQWVTKRENELHSIHVLGNKRNTKGLKDQWENPCHRVKVSLFKDGNFIKTFDSQKDCAKYLGVVNGAVNNVVKGVSKKCKGHEIKLEL